MIDISLTSSNQVLFSIDPELFNQLNTRINKASILLEKIKKSNKEVVFPTDDLYLLGKHPLSQGLIAFEEGFISAEKSREIISEIINLNQDDILNLSFEKLIIKQSNCLFPNFDTRLESIKLSTNFTYDQHKLDNSLKIILECIGSDFNKFISIVRTLTIVEAPIQGDLPYFSGADTNSWGAIHSTEPLDEYIFAEIITHETAHHWLFLLEEITPIADELWHGNYWKSPWREDLRPLGGVIHGIFVFSSVAVILASMQTRNRLNSEIVAMNTWRRICRLIAQVESGIDEIKKCSQLTDIGKSILVLANKRVQSIEKLVDHHILEKERLICNDKQSKKRMVN